jgi:hypothetical protein
MGITPASRVDTRRLICFRSSQRAAVVRGFLTHFVPDEFRPDEISILEDALEDAWRSVERSQAPWALGSLLTVEVRSRPAFRTKFTAKSSYCSLRTGSSVTRASGIQTWA